MGYGLLCAATRKMGALRGGVGVLPTPSGVWGCVFVISVAPFKAPLGKGVGVLRKHAGGMFLTPISAAVPP